MEINDFLKEGYAVEKYLTEHNVAAIAISSQLFTKVGALLNFKGVVSSKMTPNGMYAGTLGNTKVYLSPELTGKDRFIILPEGEVVTIK